MFEPIVDWSPLEPPNPPFNFLSELENLDVAPLKCRYPGPVFDADALCVELLKLTVSVPNAPSELVMTSQAEIKVPASVLSVPNAPSEFGLTSQAEIKVPASVPSVPNAPSEFGLTSQAETKVSVSLPRLVFSRFASNGSSYFAFSLVFPQPLKTTNACAVCVFAKRVM